jgi:tellurite resistance protein TerC
MDHSIFAWGGFLLFIVACLAIDLFGFNRKAHAVSMKEAAWTSAFWIALAGAFGGVVYYLYGAQSAAEYYTGWMIEKALSVDNLFVFAFLFGTYFNVPRELRHRVLFWGILSAIVMRFVFIYLGASLVNIAHAPLLLVLIVVAALAAIWFTEFPGKMWQRLVLWGGLGAAGVFGVRALVTDFSSLGLLGHDMNAVLTFFALILLASAYKLFKAGEDDAVDPKNNAVVKWVSGMLPVHPQYEGTRFMVKKPSAMGKLVWMFTPLAIVLVSVEVTDLMFATDSIPAIFAVSKDPFILFTSNIMAILGLRALYFLLESGIEDVPYLKKGLVVVLGFVGLKMLVADFIHVPIAISLGIIGGVIVLSTLASIPAMIRQRKEGNKED